MGRPNRLWYRKSHDDWVTKLDGKPVTLAKGKKNQAEARKAFHALMAERSREKKKPTAIRVDELCDRCLERIEAERKRSTFEYYHRFLRRFVQRYGALEATAIRPHHVIDWSTGYGWKDSTRRSGMTAIKAVYARARRLGLIDEDPIRDLELPPKSRRERIISDAQIEAARGATHDRFALLLEFLRESGCRPGEAARLTAVDVDRDASIAALAEHKTDAKTRKPRLIPLSARALEILTPLIVEHPDGPLFRNTRGNPWSRHGMSKAFGRIKKKTGMGREATSHAIRHRFATEAAKDHPIAVVSAILGHTNIATTMEYYVDLTKEKETLKRAINSIRPAGTRSTSESDDAGQEPEPEP
jgi:integrase/recombinase XerC